MNMIDVEPNYIPRWHCSHCGSYDVMTMDEAWFDPNNNYRFIESIESSNTMDWCNVCEAETTLDECEKSWKEWKERNNIMMKDPNNE